MSLSGKFVSARPGACGFQKYDSPLNGGDFLPVTVLFLGDVLGVQRLRQFCGVDELF